MTIRKIFIDNSVGNIPQSEQTKARSIKQNTKKRNENLENKMKTSHKTKKIIKNVAAGGFGFLKSIMNCCF